MSDLEFRSALTLDLDVVILYRLLRLRVDVFVVEQRAAYPELDGRDLEPGTRQLWLEHEGDIVATLRLLHDIDGTARIGRMCAAPRVRGTGAAAQLMDRALDLVGDLPCVLNAQEPLEDWYGRFGFERMGEAYVEDDIPHIRMRRPARPA